MGTRLPKAAFDATGFTGDCWTLVVEGAAAKARHIPSIFVLGNGFIGVRGPGEAAGSARIYLNGVFEKVPITYHEGAYGYARESDTRLAVADATWLDIMIDGSAISEPARIALDMRRGVLTSDFEREGADVRIERLVSFVRNEVIATRVTIDARQPCRIAIGSHISNPAHRICANEEGVVYDPRVTPEMTESPWCQALVIDDGAVRGRVDVLARSGFAVAAAAGTAECDVQLATGETRSFEVVTTYRAEADAVPQQLFDGARKALEAAQAAGFDALADEQQRWLESFWADADVELADLPAAERALRHGLFQLVQAAGRDGKSSIAAKGQTGEGYEGHVFWDADSYVSPVFVYTRPEIARAMLAWRIAHLAEARENARALGHEKGALYPWRTIAGRECSAFFPAGSAQYHINADIAYALRLYVETTGDVSILAEGGAEMLAETARIWLDAGFHDPERGGGFVINRVTGPDEYNALVDNNLYTNMMAAEHLRFAATVAADELEPGEAEAMVRAADAMVMPFDEVRGIYAQDESFFGKQPWPFAETADNQYPLLLHFHPLVIYRRRVAKQADAVLATVLLRDRFEPDMRRRMLDEYESVTVHDSTLSASAFACAAAAAGDAARAFDYWRVSVMTDLGDLFGNSDHGLHMAALAGGWNALALGFGGLRTIDGHLSFAPIAVPELKRYAFRLRYRGRAIELAVDGRQATYRLHSGEPVTFRHGEEEITLGAEPVMRAVLA